MSEVTMLSPEHDETCTISKLLKMYNFFTNAKNIFTACLNESNESINTYKTLGKVSKSVVLFLHICSFLSLSKQTDYCL